MDWVAESWGVFGKLPCSGVLRMQVKSPLPEEPTGGNGFKTWSGSECSFACFTCYQELCISRERTYKGETVWVECEWPACPTWCSQLWDVNSTLVVWCIFQGQNPWLGGGVCFLKCVCGGGGPQDPPPPPSPHLIDGHSAGGVVALHLLMSAGPWSFPSPDPQWSYLCGVAVWRPQVSRAQWCPSVNCDDILVAH